MTLIKNHLIILIITILISSKANTQDIFIKATFNEALQLAKKEGKLLLIQYETNGTCRQCNEVGKIQINLPEIKLKLKESFIGIYIKSKTPERNTIGALYELREDGFGTLFISGDGDLIHRLNGTSTIAKQLLEAMDAAILKSGEMMRLSTLQNMYEKTGNLDELKLLILKKEELGLPLDSLLELYTKNILSKNDFNFTTADFILNRAPILNSLASNTVRNLKAFDSLWYNLPLQKRIQLNNRIIYKSRIRAIQSKDERLANAIGEFIFKVNNYSKDPNIVLMKIYDHLSEYYLATSDTAKYFKTIQILMNKYYLTLNIDSIKNIDNELLKKAIESQPKQEPKQVMVNGKYVTTRSAIVALNSTAQYYSSKLNEGAWHVYTMSKNLKLLENAKNWIEKSLLLYEKSEIFDTYARLLYKLGNKTKALEMMEKSKVLSQKIRNGNIFEEEVYEKMKAGSTLIDEFN